MPSPLLTIEFIVISCYSSRCVHSVQKSIFAEMFHTELLSDEESNSSEEEEEEEEKQVKFGDEEQQTESNDEVDDEEDCEDNVDVLSSSKAVSTFEELGVCSWILRQLTCLGISTPSPVQANCISPILKGRKLTNLSVTEELK